MILVLLNKILVLFNRSIKVFYPCNRCHLATLLENQRVTCGNEVTRVTTNGNFALNIHSTQLLCLPNYCMRFAKISQFSIPPYGTSYSMPWNKVFHPMEQTGRCRLQGSKVPPPRVEGAASEGRRCRLRGSKVPPPRVEGAAYKGRRYGLHRRNKKLYKLIWCIPRIMLSLQKVFFYRLNNYYYEEKVYLRRLWIYL